MGNMAVASPTPSNICLALCMYNLELEERGERQADVEAESISYIDLGHGPVCLYYLFDPEWHPRGKIHPVCKDFKMSEHKEQDVKFSLNQMLFRSLWGGGGVAWKSQSTAGSSPPHSASKSTSFKAQQRELRDRGGARPAWGGFQQETFHFLWAVNICSSCCRQKYHSPLPSKACKAKVPFRYEDFI